VAGSDDQGARSGRPNVVFILVDHHGDDHVRRCLTITLPKGEENRRMSYVPGSAAQRLGARTRDAPS
jgi:hypothetical protein